MTTFSSPKTTIFLSLFLVGACTGEEKNNDTGEVQDSGVSVDSAETGEDTSVAPQDTAEVPQDTAENSEDSGTEEAIPQEYCANNDPALADCDPDINYDPWIAGTGEVHYWIREQKTLVFPFTTDDAPEVWYGYLQLTSPEVARDTGEDIFHGWFSETPNGPVIEGEGCEWYTTSAEGYIHWTFKEGDELADVCYLGEYPRTMYVNFETRCYPDLYDGLCDDDNKNKSDRVYQFDVSRRIKTYPD